MEIQELLQIKVNMSDKAALERLEPEMVTAYLARHGWNRKAPDPRAEEWWKGSMWLLVPTNRDVGDYSLRLSQVVRDVAWFDERSELAVYIDMLEGDESLPTTHDDYEENRHL